MKLLKGNKLQLIGKIITILIAALFIFSASGKLLPDAQMTENWSKLGWERVSFFNVGIVEALSLALYLIPQTAVVGAILLTGYMGGAMATHLRIQESITPHIFFGVLIWGALYLRDARLRDLIPFRKRA